MRAAPLPTDGRTLIDNPGAAPAPGWPERIALTIAIVLFVGVALWVMWRFWRRPGRGQHDLPALPTPPGDLGHALAGPFEGRYLATTLSDDPSQRFVVQGLGVAGAALLAVTDAGVYLERTGLPGLFLPAGAVRAARVEQSAVGTTYGYGTLVLIRWTHGRRTLDLAFRAMQPRRHAEVVAAVDVLVARPAAPELTPPSTPPTSPRSPEVAP